MLSELIYICSHFSMILSCCLALCKKIDFSKTLADWSVKRNISYKIPIKTRDFIAPSFRPIKFVQNDTKDMK